VRSSRFGFRNGHPEPALCRRALYRPFFWSATGALGLQFPEQEAQNMNYVMIRHKVADFAKWKTGYDTHASARTAAGLKQVHLLTNLDNPNEVVLLFAADDLNKAKAFAASPDLREAMQKAGVSEQPDVYFLTN
jgi:hypothetical protein